MKHKNSKPLSLWRILVLSIFAPAFAVAGPQPGGGLSDGGGNAVVCFKSAVTVTEIMSPTNHNRGIVLNRHLPEVSSVTAYDLALLEGVAIENSAASPRDYAIKIAERVEDVFPLLGLVVRGGASHFPEELVQKVNRPLKRLFDENETTELADPEHCLVTTIVAQDQTGRMVIDRRLFDHNTHSDLSKGVLILHEYVYKFMRTAFEETDSRRTRNIVQLLIDQSIKNSKDLRNSFLVRMEPFPKTTRALFSAAANGVSPFSAKMHRLFPWRLQYEKEYPEHMYLDFYNLDFKKLKSSVDIWIELFGDLYPLPHGAMYRIETPKALADQLISLAPRILQACPGRTDIKYEIESDRWYGKVDRWSAYFGYFEAVIFGFDNSLTSCEGFSEIERDWKNLSEKAYEQLKKTRSQMMFAYKNDFIEFVESTGITSQGKAAVIAEFEKWDIFSDSFPKESRPTLLELDFKF